MYTYPLYAMVAKPESPFLSQGTTAPGTISDEEVAALTTVTGLRQKIKATLSRQRAWQQGFPSLTHLREEYRFWRSRLASANKRKQEVLGH